MIPGHFLLFLSQDQSCSKSVLPNAAPLPTKTVSSRQCPLLLKVSCAYSGQLSLVLESDQAENVLVTGQSVNDLQQHFTCIYLPEGDPAPLAQRYESCRFGTWSAADGYVPYAPGP